MAQAPPTLPQRDMFPETIVTQFPAQTPPQRPAFRIDSEPGPAQEDVGPALLEMAQAVSRICATRILLLLSVVAAAGLWGYTVYDPTQLRIGAASLSSVLTVLPLVWLYYKKG